MNRSFFQEILGKFRDWGFILTLSAALVTVPAVTLGLQGCDASQVQTDIEKVIALMPEVTGIVTSILNIIAAAKGSAVNASLQGQINGYLTDVKSGFSAADSILTDYETNLAAAPAGVINQLDAAVASVSQNLSNIESVYPQIPASVSTGISVGVLSLQALLGYLAAIVPAQTAQALFPRAFGVLSSHGVHFGSPVVIPSPREFAKSYNSKVGHIHGAKIHTPWVRVGFVPVWP